MGTLTLASIERWPADIIRLFLLELTPATVKELCSSSKKMHAICKDPGFRAAYRETHSFKRELKNLFMLYMTLPADQAWYFRDDYDKYVALGIDQQLVMQMIAEKEYERFQKDPGRLAHTYSVYFGDKLDSDDPLYKPVFVQSAAVAAAARRDPTQKGAEEWLLYYRPPKRAAIPKPKSAKAKKVKKAR